MALDLGLSKSTVAFMAKNNYGIKRVHQGRPKVITKVEDLRIKREVARLKQHKEKITSRKNQKNCNVEAARRTIQRALRRLGFFYKNERKTIILTEKHKKIV